jgi:predicted MFS family arabinose efflux permease
MRCRCRRSSRSRRASCRSSGSPSGIALNSTQFNLSRIVGPSLVGVLMLSVGAAGAFAVSAASYVPFILMALWVLPRGAAAAPHAAAFDRGQMIANIRRIGGDPALRGALLTVLATSLLAAPLIAFCPVLIRDAFGSDVTHYSLMMACLGVGELVGATGLLAVDPERNRRALCSLLAAAFGAVVMLAAVNRRPWSVPTLFALAGAAMTASNASANTLLQAFAPARQCGQAVGLYMLVMRGGMAVGAFATGISVHYAGVREALFVNGLLAVGIQLTIVGRAWRRAAMVQPHA